MSGRLIIVRHGETDWNKEKLIQGVTDIPLNETGKKQAESLAEYLHRYYAIDAIFCSPLQRAWQTAACFAGLSGLPIQKEEGLKEIHFGDWEGKTFAQIGKSHPEALAHWVNDPSRCVIPGKGESVKQVYRRFVAVARDVCEKYEGKSVLIVSHHVPCKMILAEAIGLSLEQMHGIKLENCGVNVLDIGKERSVLRRLNEMPYHDPEQMKGEGW